MGRLINNVAMTVDGVIDVSDWFVTEGEHDDAARSLFEGNVALFVGRRNYESEYNGDLVMSGAGELARQLVEAGLVDELCLWIHPRIQGSGTRPYDAATIPVRLLEARRFETGVILLRCQPIPALA